MQRLAVLFSLLLAFIVFTLAANATEGKTAGKPAPHSLLAIHTSGQLNGARGYTKKLCLGCHTRESLIPATEGLGGQEGFNPHSSHIVSPECTECHSLSKTNVLYCNRCHVWKTPEGWANPVHESRRLGGKYTN